MLYADTPPDNAGRALRSFTYQAIGQLAGRSPALVRSRVDIAVRCFEALSTEPSGIRAAVQEATSTLAAAYEGCSGVYWNSVIMLFVFKFLDMYYIHFKEKKSTEFWHT